MDTDNNKTDVAILKDDFTNFQHPLVLVWGVQAYNVFKLPSTMPVLNYLSAQDDVPKLEPKEASLKPVKSHFK